MENNNHNLKEQGEGAGSNIIFGTSSDAIEEGLHKGQFIEDKLIDDKNQIVNEQDQNEIVNPSEENFNEEVVADTLTPAINPTKEVEEKIIPSLESEDEEDNKEDPITSEEK